MRLQARSWLAAALLAAAGTASAGITVDYVKPDEFMDMPRSQQDRERVLKEVTRHFNDLAKDLPAGQELKVTVTDIDLAGREEPRRWAIDDIRIMRGGADWPTMKLSYTLEQGGQVLRSGEETLKNMMYQQRINRYSSGDPLRYEKQMIEDWFQKAILGSQVSQK
ncbi:DUF3016 domain-containing protein [Pseudoduganella umbonata]|uniref:DUF3016 domain-containing protein n=1 Tax=Pseudoduganella umbonata TaxID=864828 RepID=A0A4P8HW78_9BURK|nr:DUF3016 domain-containing protein [Pseudoduganella umbonata]MBB3223009.1 Tfp pilus assembly protein PilO [Pseudoduganella umbonata]QCP13118.1 DUF3016 domain-containing protein [Pseudoduganella umbonata]